MFRNLCSFLVFILQIRGAVLHCAFDALAMTGDGIFPAQETSGFTFIKVLPKRIDTLYTSSFSVPE